MANEIIKLPVVETFMGIDIYQTPKGEYVACPGDRVVSSVNIVAIRVTIKNYWALRAN